MRLVYGAVGILAGFLVIKYSVWITDTFGRVDWAEKYLSGGMAGTYSFYRIAGVVIIFLSALYMFGSIGSILAPVGNLFGGQ